MGTLRWLVHVPSQIQESIVSPRRPCPQRNTLLKVASTLLMSALLIGACGDDQPNQRVVPADESVAGKSLTDLVADWTTNLHEVPLEESFLADLANCDMGRSTDDVYYAPTWATPGESSVSCTMRADQALLLVPAALLFVEDEEGLGEDGLDEEWNLTSSSVVLDGETIAMDGRQVDTPILTVSLPEGNIWELPTGDTTAITRAQAVAVEGLTVGTHEVVLTSDFGNGEFAGTLRLFLVVEE